MLEKLLRGRVHDAGGCIDESSIACVTEAATNARSRVSSGVRLNLTRTDVCNL